MWTSSSMASSMAAVVLAICWATPVAALDGAQAPTLMGCYDSSEGLTYNDTVINQSSGHCQTECFSINKAVMAMINGKDCWCGDNMPPLTTKVDSSNCDTPCNGYPPDICGSSPGALGSYYSVWNSGLNSKVYNLENSTSSSSPTLQPTSSAASATAPADTVVVTASVAPSSSNSPSSGPSTAGIAAGVVVGIIAIAAIAGGIWFYIRAKRHRELEEEHKRQAAATAFINAGKPTSSAGSSHDTRLDPIMTQRRMSDGSIADNQDYSRRILKVTNA